MKVNLQKIIIPILVLNICLSLLGVSAFAYTGLIDYEYTSAKDAYLDTVNLVEAYSNGEITYDEFASGLLYVQGKAATAGLDVAAVKIQQFIDVCNLKFGPDSSFGGSEHGGGSAGGSRTPITDLWNDICNKNNVPTETTQTSTTPILDGYGACIVVPALGGGGIQYIYCQYVVIDNENNKILRVAPIIIKTIWDDGHITWSQVNYANYNYKLNNNNIISMYGDIRYADGTPAPSDDEYEYSTIRNFDEMDDSEIVDLLKDISEKLEQEYPDLTSIEGLLRALYARLGTLDSDDDNSLLAAILSALQAIENGDNETYFQKLKDIYNDTLSEHYEDVKEDLTIDENTQSSHYNLLKTRLLEKFSFIDNIKNFVTYCFQQYSSSSQSPKIDIKYNNISYSINFNYFNDVMPTVRIMLAAYFYLTYAYHTYRKIPSYINGGDNE